MPVCDDSTRLVRTTPSRLAVSTASRKWRPRILTFIQWSGIINVSSALIAEAGPLVRYRTAHQICMCIQVARDVSNLAPTCHHQNKPRTKIKRTAATLLPLVQSAPPVIMSPPTISYLLPSGPGAINAVAIPDLDPWKTRSMLPLPRLAASSLSKAHLQS